MSEGVCVWLGDGGWGMTVIPLSSTVFLFAIKIIASVLYTQTHTYSTCHVSWGWKRGLL